MVILSALHEVMELDRRLLLWLNGFHADWLDPLVYYTTQTLTWLPLYAFLMWLVVKEFKKEWWVPIIGIFVTILLADQITSSIMKPYFARLRPSQEPSLQGIIHLVTHKGEIYMGGLYGFASSHAANTFGTATFFALLFRSKYRWMNWLFLWAVLMTYTRIYLGVHYPGDIVVGMMVGVMSAVVGYKVHQWTLSRIAT